jgi:hypothetical protein
MRSVWQYLPAAEKPELAAPNLRVNATAARTIAGDVPRAAEALASTTPISLPVPETLIRFRWFHSGSDSRFERQ